MKTTAQTIFHTTAHNTGIPGKAMSSIFTPVNQVRLTNVSVVRLRKGGKRFEIACYRNKVQDWRTRVTRRLDEVLQSRHVFLNVSKGAVAREADLREAFGTADVDAVVLEILNTGEVQVAAEERGASLEARTREVATIVAERILNPRTRAPYPVAMVEQAMSELARFSPNMARSAKQQALDVLRALEAPGAQARFPTVRAQMRVVLEGGSEAFWAEAARHVSSWEDAPGAAGRTALIDPSAYRPLLDAADAHGGTVSVVALRDRSAPK